MIELAAGPYRLCLDAERGGAVTAFEWQDLPVLRPAVSGSMLEVASFALVPFSNRIAFGRFVAGGRHVSLAPNFPDSDHPHTIHGFGWLAAWRALDVTATAATLEHRYAGGEWPWPYVCRQRFVVSAHGLTMSLSLKNLGDCPMPAGLGFHPYFPRDEDTVYHGLHCGEWENGATCLPERLERRSDPVDWWDGRPVSSREVDTLYTDRKGPLRMSWPSRGISVEMTPSASLPHTIVYSPADKPFFCVEPVSHMTNAVNMDQAGTGLQWLSKGEAFAASVTLSAS